MKKSTLDTWKKLQSKNYFKNHPLYDEKTVGIPHCVESQEILDKNIIDIGCGYGRDTVFFSKYAKHVYGVDVSSDILRVANKYIEKNGDISKTTLVKAEQYEEQVPNNIDYVYALHVFQHLSPEQAKEYIASLYKKMNFGGRINIQFFIGEDKMMDEGKEPRIQYSKENALKLMRKFKIDKTWTLQKFNKNNNIQYEHLYIVGIKL